MYRTEALRDISDLELVRDFWDSNVCHPNVDMDFFLTIVSSREEIVRPHVIVVWREETVVSLLIGRIEERRRGLRLAYMNLPGPKLTSLVVLYQGCIGLWDDEIAESVGKELQDSLSRKEADVLDLRFLKADSALLNFLAQKNGSLRPGCERRIVHWKMAVPDSVESLLSHLSSNQRHTTRRERRKFERHFGDKLRFECFTEPETLSQSTKDIESIARTTYHRGLGVGFALNEENLQRMELEARRGGLRIYVLYYGTRPVAFYIGTQRADTFYLHFTGYVPEFSQFSPGKNAFLLMLEDLAENTELREIDFGFGDAFYKRVFADCSWEEVSLSLFGPSVRGFVSGWLETACLSANKQAKRILERRGVIGQFKRKWRNRLQEVARKGA